MDKARGMTAINNTLSTYAGQRHAGRIDALF